MDHSARNEYLQQEVMTASPQKLQLMLIEAAIRSSEKARECWRNDDVAGGCEALIHAQSCIGELLGGLNSDDGGELVRRLAGLYMFIFRCLVDANQQRDEKPLAEALRVLAMERDTWRQVCRQHQGDGSAERQPPTPAPPPAPLTTPDLTSLDASGGLSLEA